jgi:hypothetical protein
MRDRIRWQASGAPLERELLITIVQHVAHWREKVQAYELFVPRASVVGPQLWGELLLLERIAVRGAVPDPVATLLDALSELTGLAPSLTFTVMTDDVVFSATPMGFERRARAPGDAVGVRPESWVPVSEVAPLARPILTLGDEARLHAVPLRPPEGDSGFRDLDADDDATAMMRAEAIGTRAATASALLLVVELRDRPRSEEQQRAFDHATVVLGFAQVTGVAPSLVLLLEGARPERARDRDWCELVVRSVEADERTRPDVASVRHVLGDGSTRAVLELTAERRAQLRALEAADVESARHVAAAAQRWFAINRERLEQLSKLQ